ncbi:MAG: T9SS C-terminal target domain-containing protein [Flavobacteriia bacterium]|nr:T9SS C-terminal target domain-containing protein [Flavobacteriia bacterium]
MKRLLILMLSSFSFLAWSQPHSVLLEPISVSNFSGVQSFAVGKSNGKWLIIGGRLDGLHQRQPFASFDAAGHNNQLIVIDPVAGTSWSAPLTSLSTALQVQLKSTNMEFTQVDSTLYLIGGYGMNANGDHVTFNNLTAVNVPAVIDAIINNQPFASYFRQISDSNFKVTGGQLYRLDGVFYLVGGQLFDGRYNPHGPTHGPGFTQAYTNEVRKFKITDDGTNLSVQFLPFYTDNTLLHKRDYNAVPYISANAEGIVALSGVFQPTVDLPWLNAVDIDSTGFNEVAGFTQYYNHYHSAKVALHEPTSDVMHYYIFGGIAQYYLQNGVQVQDNDVPFVKTISHIERDATGSLTETPLTVEMPDYLGAGAEFIPLDGLAHFNNEILDYSALSGDSILIGYIVGGIKSSAPNIFFINTGSESEATPAIYKVYLVDKSISVPETKPDNRATIRPNPSVDKIHIDLQIGAELNSIQWIDQSGRVLQRAEHFEEREELILSVDELPRGIYTLVLTYTDESVESFRLAVR